MSVYVGKNVQVSITKTLEGDMGAFIAQEVTLEPKQAIEAIDALNSDAVEAWAAGLSETPLADKTLILSDALSLFDAVALITSLLNLGHSIRIWLNADKVFAGLVGENTPMEGGLTRLSGRDFSQKLLLRTKSKNWSGREVSLAVKDLVEDLPEVSTYNVETPTPTVTVIGASYSNPSNDPDEYTDEDDTWTEDDPDVMVVHDYAAFTDGKCSIRRVAVEGEEPAYYETEIDLGSSGVDFSHFTRASFSYKASGIIVSKQYDFFIRLIDTSSRVAKKKYLDTSQSLPSSWAEYDYALSDFTVDSGFDWQHIRYIQMCAYASSPPNGTIYGSDWWDRLCLYTPNITKTATDGSSSFAHTREHVLCDERLVDPEFVQEVADALLASLSQSENRFRIPVAGSPEIQAGKKVSVNVPSHGLSGAYYVAEARHKVTAREGFVTEVVLEEPTLSLETLLSDAIERKIRLIERGDIT